MKKIVLLINAEKFSPETLDFAANIAKLSGSAITGLFIHDTTIVASEPEMRLIGGQAYVEEIAISEEEQKAIQDTIENNIRLFHDGCAKRGVTSIAQLEKGIAMDIITHESRYADMFIASPLLSFNGDGNVPTVYVKEILTEAQCPVLLSAEANNPIDEIVIAYDNSKSSIFAIKQFSYLLPALLTRNVTVLYVSEDGKNDITEQDEISFTNWLEARCTKYSFVTLTGNASDVLLNYFLWNDNNNKLLISGGYGRSAVSRFFKAGTTELVLKTADVPIFIAHN